MLAHDRIPVGDEMATVAATRQVVLDWRTAAIAAYRRSDHDETATMLAELAARVRELTGRRVAETAILSGRSATGERTATVAVDGAVFALWRGKLVLLVPCIHCGLGQLASPAIESRADLGYTLAGWKLRCQHCEPEDLREYDAAS